MKVQEIMNPVVRSCRPSDDLAWAAELMWENDCGILPVVGEDGVAVGMINDRDICMSAAMNRQNPTNLAVESVISGEVYACSADDDMQFALSTMREHRVRRLPVIDAKGKPIGMLSMNDLVLHAQPATGMNLDQLLRRCGQGLSSDMRSPVTRGDRTTNGRRCLEF